jgi:diketogulonate reductase-like aldo/keto reductase
MPINGLGTYSLHGDECINSVKTALASGVRLIDTASAYGNEEEVGQAIRESIEEGIVEREDVFVITKIYPGSEMANPEESIQACIDRLNIGYVDMMLLHHPDRNDVKAYQAMEKFVEAGQIRSLGLSNWYVKELDEFLPQVTIIPALVQNEIHPYYQENDVIPYHRTVRFQLSHPSAMHWRTAQQLCFFQCFIIYPHSCGHRYDVP